MTISNRRMTMYTNRFLAAFDSNWRNATASVIFDRFCEDHGLPQDERNQFMHHLQSQGVM